MAGLLVVFAFLALLIVVRCFQAAWLYPIASLISMPHLPFFVFFRFLLE